MIYKSDLYVRRLPLVTIANLKAGSWIVLLVGYLILLCISSINKFMIAPNVVETCAGKCSRPILRNV
jgi:hypothetical protein